MGLIRIFKNRRRVLGLNERYLGYIRPYNKRRSFRIADNKIRTKQVLKKAGIPVPPLIKVIRNYRDLNKLDFETLPSSFVIKPVHGLEGGGIEIFYNRKDGYWIKSDGSRVSVDDMRAKLEDILDGKYSLHNQADQAMLEERIKPHPEFRAYTYKGTPDVRIIVFNSIPIMSYVRLPTRQSEGKANLIIGAIGAAVDIAEGRVTTAILGKKGEIEYVPEKQTRLSGLRIPYWSKMLEYAVQTQQVTGLGFAAVDFLIDRENGPMVVEIGARAGLSIQLANKDGLRWRLERVKGLKVGNAQKGIRLGKELFGGEIEETVENITGKQVIGIIEDIEIYGPNGDKEALKAKIDTGADSTSVDRKLLERLGYSEILAKYDEFIKKEIIPDISQDQTLGDKFTEELTSKVKLLDLGVEKIGAVYSSHGVSLRPYLKVKIKLSGVEIETVCSVYDRSKLTYSIIVGKKSLTKFLIDPSKK